MQAGLVTFLFGNEWLLQLRLLAGFGGEEKVISFLSHVFIPLLNEMRVFGCWSCLFLSLFLVILGLVTSLQFPPRICQFPPQFLPRAGWLVSFNFFLAYVGLILSFYLVLQLHFLLSTLLIL
jgi:hypothetical protein